MPTIASKVRPGSELGKVGVSRLMLTNAFSSTTVKQFKFEYPKTTPAVSKTKAATTPTDDGKEDIENEPKFKISNINSKYVSLTFLCFIASLLRCHKCWPETAQVTWHDHFI